MVYKAKVGIIERPHVMFWRVVSVVFGVLAIFAVLIALHCAQTLVCVDTYEDEGRKYCISEIKEK